MPSGATRRTAIATPNDATRTIAIARTGVRVRRISGVAVVTRCARRPTTTTISRTVSSSRSGMTTSASHAGSLATTMNGLSGHSAPEHAVHWDGCGNDWSNSSVGM